MTQTLKPTTRTGSYATTAPAATISSDERAAALSFLQKLAAEVSDGSIDLPCFPNVVIRISTALADPATSADQVVTIVGAEPRLAARIVQVANSAAFNASGKPLTDLKAAITRLGHQMVHGTAMSYAMLQVKNQSVLRAIAQPLNELWNRSVAVASICRIVARLTRVSADEAFLTGLLHGIGYLYIMARAATHGAGLPDQQSWIDLLTGWQAAIGESVLESWGLAPELCEAIGDQNDRDRRWRHEASLSDVLIASLLLNDALNTPSPNTLVTDGVGVFTTVGINASTAPAVLSEAEEQIRLVHQALGT